jgi:hypothetical protein
MVGDLENGGKGTVLSFPVFRAEIVEVGTGRGLFFSPIKV